MNIYKVIMTYDEVEAFLYFDDEDRAKRYIKTMNALLTEKGKTEVDFQCYELSIMTDDNMVIEFFEKAFDFSYSEYLENKKK